VPGCARIGRAELEALRAGTYLGVPKPPSLMSRHPPSAKHCRET
jgi:hypothetical protein